MKSQLPPTKIFTSIILFLFTNFIYCQTQPFPANKVFGYGLMATNRNSQDALESYNTWKDNFIEACTNNRFRVKFDNSTQTVSEGIGYGMLLTAYKGDQTIFDGLWNYYKDNRNSNGVMNWKINGCSGTIGDNGATDAELDVAMALIVADYQWGSTGTINYKTDATALISIIKNKEIEANTFVIKPGDVFGGSSLTNPSYLAPAYCKTFGTYTNDTAYWNKVATKCYTILNANLTQNNAVGGLVSDWCQASGAYSSEASGYANQGKTYTYDAARTPWRIATDYVWYGNNDAKTYSKKTSDFVRTTLGGTANIKDGYNQNGTVIGQWHNATFVGAFAAAAMGGENQTHLDNSYADLKNLNEPNNYFNHTLKTLYLFLLNGNFYLPPTVVLSNNQFNDSSLNVSVFPNPNSGEFTINTPIESQIKVFDAQGKIILIKTVKTNSTILNLNKKASGFYFIQIEHDGKKEVKKVILN
jgi:endo-1,4-beta-D-glucanase Y